jgi:hypothetical protein
MTSSAKLAKCNQRLSTQIHTKVVHSAHKAISQTKIVKNSQGSNVIIFALAPGLFCAEPFCNQCLSSQEHQYPLI